MSLIRLKTLLEIQNIVGKHINASFPTAYSKAFKTWNCVEKDEATK